jgi:hypothetical protein
VEDVFLAWPQRAIHICSLSRKVACQNEALERYRGTSKSATAAPVYAAVIKEVDDVLGEAKPSLSIKRMALCDFRWDSSSWVGYDQNRICKRPVGINGLVLTLRCVETWCRVKMSCNASGAAIFWVVGDDLGIFA